MAGETRGKNSRNDRGEVVCIIREAKYVKEETKKSKLQYG